MLIEMFITMSYVLPLLLNKQDSLHPLHFIHSSQTIVNYGIPPYHW